LNELIPEGDWEYFEDRDMSAREAAGEIKFMKDVTETLGLRENRYGEFKNVSETSQWLKDIMRGGASWIGDGTIYAGKLGLDCQQAGAYC
jgi:hypothetical protein